jgi:hypothetical protein
VRTLIRDRSHVLQSELNLSYAVRLIACGQGPENEETLNKVYERSRSVLVRRDVILAMSRWKAAYWLSDLVPQFRTFTPAERRGFLIGSFTLTDQGRHWRHHIAPELSPFEKLVRDWAAEKSQSPDWSMPL